MNTRKYFLNEHIIPNHAIGSNNFVENVFSEPFISLNDLLYNVQNQVNESACQILNAPDEGAKRNAEIKWETLYMLLTELQKI